MKSNYFVIIRNCKGQPGFQDKNHNMLLAQPIAIPENYEVLSTLRSYAGIISATIFPTKKRAQEIADAWNEGLKRNGTYAF